MPDQPREGNLVVVRKRDRLSHSPKDVLQIMEQICGARADFRSLAGNIGAATPAGRIGARRKKSTPPARHEIAENVISGRKAGAEMSRLYNASAPTVSRTVAAHRTGLAPRAVLNQSFGDPR